MRDQVFSTASEHEKWMKMMKKAARMSSWNIGTKWMQISNLVGGFNPFEKY